MKHYGKACIIGLAACLVAGYAGADPYYRHPRTSIHWGIQIGGPWIFPPFYPYPYSVYVPQVYVPPAPAVTYVEQPAAVMEPGFWYYCNEVKAYYPQVQQCPGPWRKVAPRPAE